MKKNTKKLMAAGLLCAIALTLTACAANPMREEILVVAARVSTEGFRIRVRMPRSR